MFSHSWGYTNMAKWRGAETIQYVLPKNWQSVASIHFDMNTSFKFWYRTGCIMSTRFKMFIISAMVKNTQTLRYHCAKQGWKRQTVCATFPTDDVISFFGVHLQQAWFGGTSQIQTSVTDRRAIQSEQNKRQCIEIKVVCTDNTIQACSCVNCGHGELLIARFGENFEM
jgi:hypothetical protein